MPNGTQGKYAYNPATDIDPDETPKRSVGQMCGMLHTDPFVHNLSGWTYPRKGAFDNFHVTQMNDVVNGEMGDAEWDYKYMKEAASMWKNCKTLWNKSFTRKICYNVVH